MKKITILIFVIILTGCTAPTEKDIICSLLKEYMKERIADFESFEIIDLSNIDSVFTQLMKQDTLIVYANSFYDNQRKKDELAMDINGANARLEELKTYYEEARSQVDYAYLNLSQFLRYDRNGNRVIGPTIQSVENLNRAEKKLKRVVRAMDLERKHVTVLKNQISALQKSDDLISRNVTQFSNSFRPIYLGKGGVLKCRYKDEHGNMQIKIFDILLNNDLDKVIKVEEPSNTEDIEQFILDCRKEE